MTKCKYDDLTEEEWDDLLQGEATSAPTTPRDGRRDLLDRSLSISQGVLRGIGAVVGVVGLAVWPKNK